MGCKYLIGLFRIRNLYFLCSRYLSLLFNTGWFHIDTCSHLLRFASFFVLRFVLRYCLVSLYTTLLRFASFLVIAWLRWNIAMIPSTCTKRGFGECPQCKSTYSTRWKPANCHACGFFLGGSKEPATKKPKSCCPAAVVVIATEEMSIFSTKTSTRDDRCFVMKEGDMFFCSHKDCISVRATFVSSGRAASFSCKHSDECKDAVPPQESFELSRDKIENYNGDNASKKMLTALLGSLNSMTVVVKVSDISYAVLGFPSTNNTMGYSHVKILDGVLTCSSKDTDCRSFVAKGRYERAKKFCVHLHAIFCTGGYRQEHATSTSTSCIADPLPSASSASPLPSQRMKTMELNSSRQFLYDFISPALLRAIDARNATSWPSLLYPTASACELCGHNLGNQIKHPGSEGQAYLVTCARPYSKVEVRVKVCQRETCRAIHQVDPSDIGECRS